jgi:hypothetical protein
MKKAFSRLLAWLMALLLLPACWAATTALWQTLMAALVDSAFGGQVSPQWWALIGGAVAYALWHMLRPPEFLYTFGHEMTHLLFAFLMGKRVGRLEVSKRGGAVSLSGTNPFITLAPYFFPLVTAIVLAGGEFITWVAGDGRFRLYVAFLAGLTLAFHGGMTWRTLRTAQPDIARSGWLFSCVFIYLMGVLVAGGAIITVANGPTALVQLARAAGEEALRSYHRSGGAIIEIIGRAVSEIGGKP